MAKDFARGERMMRRPDLQQGRQNDIEQSQKSSQQQGRFQPNWANQGQLSDTWEEDTTPPPIPERIKTNAWMKRWPKSAQTEQVGSTSNLDFAKGGGSQPSNVNLTQPMLVANAATMGMGEFIMKQIAKRSPGLAAKAAGLSLVDGPLPIGELISIGLTAWTAYEIYQDWKKYQANARRAQDGAIGSEPLQMSNTSREGDNHFAKAIRREAGRTGDPCDIWKVKMQELEQEKKSTRDPKIIKELNKLINSPDSFLRIG